MAQGLAVAADRGHAAGAEPRIVEQGQRSLRECPRQFHVDLADFVEGDAIGGLEEAGDPALELGVEGGGAGGDDPEWRYVEVDEGRVDRVHTGPGHQAKIEAHVRRQAYITA